MARSVVSIAVFALVAGMSLLMHSAVAQPDSSHQVPGIVSEPVGRSMLFNIPAQSLQTALDAFGEQTRFAGLYSAASIKGLMSAPVSGRYTPDVALRLMLERTGLEVHYTAPDAFVLETIIAPNTVERNAVYDGMLQAGVRDVFCREPAIAALSYRIALRFYVDIKGRITQALLLDSTGDTGRDKAILQALKKVDLGRGPANTSLPFFMLILPQQLATDGDCRGMAVH